MKVFWSWQSDTPGKIGRHFVRDALAAAIQILKEHEDVEEPGEREVRDALHLDHDRKGVSGSPDLAHTIFKKIDQASVFIADVTLVGVADYNEISKSEPTKRFINSNVAIEYGYAARGVGDEAILMVQNSHYGARDGLPFDLKHKAGPLQYDLAPTATTLEITTEHAKLRGILVEALRPYVGLASIRRAYPTKFEEIPSTANPATFWQASEVLVTLGRNADRDHIDYRFDKQHVFYLRLIPIEPIARAINVVTLMDMVEQRGVQVLTRTIHGAMPGRNRFGAIAYEPSGMATSPIAFSQLFRNGEIWGVSSEFTLPYEGALIVPMENVRNIFLRVLANFISVAVDLGVRPPYQIELGAVGLANICVSLPPPLGRFNQFSDPMYEDHLRIRRLVSDPTSSVQERLIEEFRAQIYDLAGVKIP